MSETLPDLAHTRFVLPPDVKLLPVAELSARVRARLGAEAQGQSVLTRQGFRVSTRLLPQPLALLIGEFRVASRLTDAVLRFARAHGQDPQAVLELAFEALAQLVEARLLVPQDAPEASAPGPSLAAGQVFAGFEIEALVRSLEDSEVFRARAPSGHAAALKIARDVRPGVAALLTREAATLQVLGGGDSPRLLAHGNENGRTYVAMQWCDGVSIGVAAQQLRAARDWPRLHRLVGHMLAAYGRLHRRGLLHGDIHPGNCLADFDGKVFILDFGHARPIAQTESATDLARVGIAQFYDPQMAQALLAGQVPPPASPASEQYAIGVLAYMLLTGLHPIDSPMVQDELLRRIARRRPLPFTARGVAAWPGVEATIARALAHDPAARHADVASFAQAFAAAPAAPPPAAAPRGAPERAWRAAMATLRRAERPTRWRRDMAWLTLRSALAAEDVELLAAADRLAAQAPAGWAACVVQARTAQARADARAEGRAIRDFLAMARMPHAPGAPLPSFAQLMLAAACMLEGPSLRNAEGQLLGAWAAKRMKRLVPAAPRRHGGSADELALCAALSLVRAGRVSPPAALEMRLQALAEQRVGSAWLWALAHDVFADERYRRLALCVGLPRQPLMRGFAALRLYQLGGDACWLAEARRASVQACNELPHPLGAALLQAELQMPETASLPPFPTLFGVPVPLARAVPLGRRA